MERILYLDEISEIAGAANCLIRLTTGLDRTRFTPLVACPPGPLAERIAQAGIEHIPYRFRMRRMKTGTPDDFVQGANRRYVNPLALLQKVREGVEIARLVRRHKARLIQTNSLSAHLAGLVASRLARVPVFWHIHLFYPRLLYRFVLPDYLIFVSHVARRAAFPNGSPPRAHVIYNGQDLAAFDPDTPHQNLRGELGLAHDHPLIGIVAQLLESKGHRELFRAWQLVSRRYPQARLLVVGDEIARPERIRAYRTELEQLAQDLNIADTVIFTGFRSDIVNVLHTLDVLVSASTPRETFSLSVLEGMAMRKAIVATNAGGVPEVIGAGEVGLLVEYGDTAAMAEAMGRLLDDPALRERLGEAARRRALSRFSLEHHIAQIQALYEEALARR